MLNHLAPRLDNMLQRIGIVNQTSGGWAAAATYTRMLLHSLEAACHDPNIELVLLAEPSAGSSLQDSMAVNSIQLNSVQDFPGERSARRLLRKPDKTRPLRGEMRVRHWLQLRDTSNVFSVARSRSVDVLLPVLDLPPWRVGIKTIGWIPDFQHVHLPEFFSEGELRRRDNSMRRLAEKATILMLSSQTALEHFRAFAPGHSPKARVVSFPSLFAFIKPAGDPGRIVAKYNLPEKFALVANQFWAHKNHGTVIEALRLLREKGLRIPVVMTGLPVDHRDPSNQTLSRVLQAIAMGNLSSQFTILGQVPYPDLANLMRATAVVIQPSQFEGWSTIVEDSKALGRPLLCSDIAVHREQAPDALGFFPHDDGSALAELLAAHWSGLTPGPDAHSEEKALAIEREFAQRHGKLLLGLCEEAYSI